MSEEAEARAIVVNALTKFAALVATDPDDDARAELMGKICNDPFLALPVLDLAVQSLDRVCGLLGEELGITGAEMFAMLIDGMRQALG